MAIAVSVSSHSPSIAIAHNLNSVNTRQRKPRFYCSVPSKTIPKSSTQKQTHTSLQNPSQELSKKVVKADPETNLPPKSPDSGVPVLLKKLRDGFRFNEIGLEMVSVALPAALALAADPITSLVDTAFVGHIGPAELGAVGVSASIFNLVSKLFNVPLLNITTSFVAEEQALVDKCSGDTNELGFADGCETKKSLPSISTSLALAAGLGIAETVALSAGSGFLMNIMGIHVDSPMRVPAEEFLTLRAFGAPAIVVALAAQGTFRGFKDTKTPLYAIGAGNLLNAILDLVLIFPFGLGVGGAAIATVISEYLLAFILLWKLNDEVQLISPNLDGKRVVRYLKSGGLLMGRTSAVLLTMTLATSMAAREGPIPMAGYQICTQVWLAVSLITDALAIAGQTLLARSYTEGNYEEAQEVVYMALQIGLATGVGLAFILFLGFGAFSRLFSSDTEVLRIALSGTLFVVGSQPINAIAFVIDGLYYGVSDFGYAAYSMVLVALLSSAFLLGSGTSFGVAGVWTGLFLFMALRVAAGIWRLGMKSGPWELVWSETKQGSD